MKGKTGEATVALRVVQEKRQLGVGELLPVLMEGHAQDLPLGETGNPLTGASGVTQIL